MRLVTLVFFILALSINVLADGHPKTPDQMLTPGMVCEKADAYRYPEHISYCKRDVSLELKWQVIGLYMQKFTYLNINNSNRNEYKIDHYIPLCMGGSNNILNLWPQHNSVYRYTDSLELNICKELEFGVITQAVAIAKIKFAKTHLNEVMTSKDAMTFVRENYNR